MSFTLSCRAEAGGSRIFVAVEEPAAARRLLPGVQGRIRVEIGARRALVVPRSALVETADGEGLFTVDGGVARFVRPELGAAAGDRQEVLAGFDAGTAVVVEPREEAP